MANKVNDIKKEIVLYAKLLDAKGLVNTLEGNISILDRETGRIIYHTFGTRKAFVDEDMVAVVKDGKQIAGSVNRSSEYLLQ